MKYINIVKGLAIATMCCTVTNTFGQNLAEMVIQAERGDVVVAKTLVAALNADTPMDSIGLYNDVVEDFIGNYPVGAKLKYAQHRGASIGPVGAYQNFDGNNSFGGGIELAYFSNHWGASVTGTVSNGYPDKTSMNQAQFRQYDAMGRLYWLPDFLQFDNHHLWIAPYAEFSYKYNRDYQEEGGTYKDVAYDNNGKTTTTTTIFNKLDNRASTMGGAIGLYVGYEFWGTPIRVHVAADYGKQQNLTFMRDMWHNRLKVEAGVSFTLRKVHKNKKAMNALGITPSELPKMW
jgi:hypothetical protein